jgi:hypothetical protein
LPVSTVTGGCDISKAGSVGVASPGHRDVQQGSGAGFADDGVGGVGGDALGGVHGDGVAQADVLAHILEPLGGHPVGGGVDGGYAPALAAAHRIHQRWWLAR